ncbi:MAG: serine/threonine-protein kinase, partial [Planctomycetota bacterium]
RDIKPSNVLVSSIDLKAKILDFGLAKVIERSSQGASGVLGTPWYMSPEQVLGTTTDSRTDIYCYGVTLFEILTGQLPFKGRDFGYHHVHTEPPRADEVNPALTRHTGDLIAKCLRKEPSDRYQSADEMRRDLRMYPVFEGDRLLPEKRKVAADAAKGKTNPPALNGSAASR